MKNTELVIKINKKEEIELFVALLSLGMSTAPQNDSISTDLSQQIIFSPYILEVLTAMEVDEDLINLIKHGGEMNDLKALPPEALRKIFEPFNSTAHHIIKEKSENLQTIDEEWNTSA